MNETNIAQFIRETEEYLRIYHQHLSQSELDRVTELYEDLNNELARQQQPDDLYL